MAKEIHKCTKCGTYTLRDNCPLCNEPSLSPMPPKYSPEDKYGDYRRKVKRKELEKAGLV